MSIEIKRKSTPHFSSRKQHVPDMICVHQTGGSLESCINWFKNPESKVSAHFVVSKKGEIIQFVDLECAAWCNGTNSNDHHAPNFYGNSPNPLIRQRKSNANLYTVSVEFENNDTGRLTEEQYCAGVQLMFHIVSELKRLYNVDFRADRLHFIGHCDCSPVNKADCPGKDFPYQDFLDCLLARREALGRLLDILVRKKRRRNAG